MVNFWKLRSCRGAPCLALHELLWLLIPPSRIFLTALAQVVHPYVVSASFAMCRLSFLALRMASTRTE